MKPNKNDFLDGLDSDRDWIHTEVLGQGRKKSNLLPIITFVLVLICFGMLAYISIKGGLSRQDLSNLDNMDDIKKEKQAESDAEKAAKEAAEAEAKKKTEEEKPYIYKVKAGDTLAGVAAEFNIDMKKIIEANELKEPYGLEIDQELKIPGVKAPAQESTAPAAPTEGTTYTVKAGDTLAGIGAELGVSYQEIMTLNGITDASKIEIGQVLKIPAKQ